MAFFKDFSFYESFSKTGKLRTCSKITRPHLSVRQIGAKRKSWMPY